jgi:Txe/YoeB family toxin of Txe-Axe toxin-antitoxin module
MLEPIKIVWDNQAKADLEFIFKTLKNGKNIVFKIIKHTKEIRFTRQYQVDELLGEPFRRVIVGHYKIVYKITSEQEIRILHIFDTRQNPDNLRI